jgi:chromosome segregation ATPase
MRLRALLPVVTLSVCVCLMGGCADLKGELQLAQGRVQELLNTKSELEAKISAFEDETKNLESRVNELVASNKDLKAEASAGNGKTAELQKLVAKLKRDNAECKKQGQAFAKEASELKAKNKQLAGLAEALKTKYTQLESQLNAIKTKNDDLSEELSKLRSTSSPAGEKAGAKPKPAPQSKDDSTVEKAKTADLPDKQELALAEKSPKTPKTRVEKSEPGVTKSNKLRQTSGRRKAPNSVQTKRGSHERVFTQFYMWNGIPVPAFMSEIFSAGSHR